MRMLGFSVVYVCLIVPNLFAQTEKPRPKFADYAVRHVYEGKPATPILSKDQRTFRTMIREGAKSHVEFAGHYTVPQFGCGSGCSNFYVVDSINGKVYDGFSIVDIPGVWVEKHDRKDMNRIEFRPDSRLLQVNGCPNEANCGFYDFVMIDHVGLKLIGKELLSKEFQP